ncbi:macrolide export ATP-binding/permease protein MacB [Janthinobacterium sp. HH104]|uniref:ABC transporter permease n=1 Tax=unclassified Janthinobacterium TaxID=2610881 RepID=UPI000874E9E9|nr:MULTISPECIES: FtsX-like permease family protein [unclassified Janthinobacterium]MBW3502323.1 ABC transporter permease [Janthinobacterium sp. NKUCC08_JDC]MDX8122955.1 FtsX-like permease family protein [Janthinobacterium sp. GMG2]OEZ87436.1 macrolide export ATP-binding/permease protein MacB [Janthinobacterium sp. HH104]
MEIRPILSALMRSKTGAVLVAVQVAISLAILANALHIVNLRQAVAARPTGVAAESDIFYVSIQNINRGSHERQLAEQKRQAALLRALPGVMSVAQTSQAVLSRSGHSTSVSAKRGQASASAEVSTYVSPDSLIRTYGLQLVEGRDFRPDEVPEINEDVDESSPKVLILTRAAAQKIWPGETSFVGKTLYQGTGNDDPELRVVGIVERLQTQGAQTKPRGEYSALLPTRLTGGRDLLMYAVRAEPGQRDRLMQEAEQAIRRSSTDRLLVHTDTLEQHRKARYRADQGLSWMLIAVSTLLLLVTASGIVGIASLWVSQRRKQIGVRRALGARRIDILRYFLTENFMITSVGVACGVLLGLGLNQLLVSQLEMARLPPGYLLAGALVFWLLGVGAVYGPAWRAASISPATATRSA